MYEESAFRRYSGPADQPPLKPTEGPPKRSAKAEAGLENRYKPALCKLKSPSHPYLSPVKPIITLLKQAHPR